MTNTTTSLPTLTNLIAAAAVALSDFGLEANDLSLAAAVASGVRPQIERGSADEESADVLVAIGALVARPNALDAFALEPSDWFRGRFQGARA